jgi:hypothetical protein
MEMTQVVSFNNALNALVLDPNIFTATVVDKLLWKYHKAVANKLQIPTATGQWFRTLIESNSTYEQQRDAIEILQQVIKYGTKTEIKNAMKSEHIAPLARLGDVMDDYITKKATQVEDTI